MENTWDVIVIGAGAAGILAATRAAERGLRVTLLEKNRKPGVKILMSGGTRCNITHATDRRGIEVAFRDQGRFLRSALAEFGPEDAVHLVESEGVPTKTESGGKIFPQSDRAVDVLNAFLRRLQRSGAKLVVQAPVSAITQTCEGFSVATSDAVLLARAVIITTGGKSYPGCGTTGDGYGFGLKTGHACVEPQPALVPILSHERNLQNLSGLTLDDVQIGLYASGEHRPRRRLLYPDGSPGGEISETKRKGLKKSLMLGSNRWELWDERRGGMLFTHRGLSGPAILDISQTIPRFDDPNSLLLKLDYSPEIGFEELEHRLDAMIAASGSRQVITIVANFIPKRLADVSLDALGISESLRAAELSRIQRRSILGLIKGAVVPIDGTLGFEKAEVTSGGIALREISPTTMESRHISNLFFAGEVLDVDGPIGGYNFQAAFSTGWLAGSQVLLGRERPPER